LLAVPNFSEGRDRATLDAIGAAFGPGLIHASADPDHHRSVFTVAGEPGALAEKVVAAAAVAVARIDVSTHAGVHPRVGAIDVAPIVYLSDDERGAACAEALVLADRLGHELELPVYLYGALAGGRTRAELRRPGALEHLQPDAGPPRLHPTAGAVLVAARPPLAAFNVYVDASLERVELKVNNATDGRHVIACNGRRVPLHPTGAPGQYVAGVRFRAWQPPQGLHPTIGVHTPLVFDVFDAWNDRAIGGFTLNVSHPGGLSFDKRPRNALEAESRRGALFSSLGHSPGPRPLPAERSLGPGRVAFPLTLDLRV